MAIDFPNSPTTGQVYTSGTRSWKYDGEKWIAQTNTSFSNRMVSFACERNGIPAVGNYWAFGNGASTVTISLPFAGKLVAATFTANSDINGTITAVPIINGVSQSTTYQVTATAASQVSTYNFQSNPLSIPAGQRLAWICNSITATVGASSITFYIRFD